MSTKCPDCGDLFKGVASHWAYSDSCSYPEFSKQQWETIVGLLMGDGCLAKRTDTNPYLTINMTNEEYLLWLDDLFEEMSTGVKLKNTAEEQAELSRSGGLNRDASMEDYKDIYTLNTRRHPKLNRLCSWYSSGEKVFPDNLTLTPTTLKHWYVCDGSFDNTGTANRIRISMNNEHENVDKVERYFKESGLPRPNFITQDRGDFVACVAQFKNSNSTEVWNYMGEPVKGFKYKWSVSNDGDLTS